MFKSKLVRKFLLVLVVFLCVLVFAGCGESERSASSEVGGLKQGDSIVSVLSENRKMHFDVSYYLDSDDVTQSILRLNNIMKAHDGYVESNTYDTYDDYSTATYVVRIPTTKLDAFMAEFENGQNIDSKSISSTDYTTQYVDTEAAIQALQQSRTLYQNMLNDTSLSMDRISEINEKLVEINTELNKLEIQKNEFDKLVEYSTVTVKFNQSTKEKFFDAFDGYGEYIYTFLQVIVGIVLYTLPFAVLAGVALGVVFICINVKKYKKAKNEENNVEKNK